MSSLHISCVLLGCAGAVCPVVAGPASYLNIHTAIVKKNSPPDILVHSLVTPEDIEAGKALSHVRVALFSIRPLLIIGGSFPNT